MEQNITSESASITSEKPFESAINNAPTAKPDTFYIGLCMAGAVSAGAYTAGVMDYLIEALQKWEDRRGRPGVPTHRVEIPVVGGASAGGMTGLLTVANLNKELAPVSGKYEDLVKAQPQNPLYHTWVDLTGEADVFATLLQNDDISEEDKIYSLLNAGFIQKIAAGRVGKVSGEGWKERPYFSENLKVFATLSNLGGFTQTVTFSGAGDRVKKYFLTRHNDYACFTVNTGKEPGKPDKPDAGWVPIDFRTITDEELELVRTSAMATGAFPIGLRARDVNRKKADVMGLPLLKDFIGDPTQIDDPYKMDFVDGGLINNEPFERVRDILFATTNPEGKDSDKQKQDEARHDYNSFRGTVLMIDPFPSTTEPFKQDRTLFSVIGHTLSAMIGHLRIKDLKVIQDAAGDPAGQFLIAPSRQVPDGKGGLEDVDGARAIACGNFEGFGGFLHKDFRIHDFLLGRANCESFLRHHFTVPANTNNQIFTNGYAGVPDKTLFTGKNGGLQIIPIFDEESPRFPLIKFPSHEKLNPAVVPVDWPVRRPKELYKYEYALRDRVQKISATLVKGMPWSTRALIWGAGILILNKRLARFALDKMEKALVGHQLLLTDDEQLKTWEMAVREAQAED